MNIFDVRLLSFAAAIIAYAFLGSPTPDNPGWVEAFIAAALIISVGFHGVYQTLKPDFALPLWQSAGRLFLLFGLTFPTLKGVLSGHDLKIIVRDIVPFLFVCLPLFVSHLLAAKPKFAKLALNCVLVLGLVFSVRASVEHIDSLFYFAKHSGELTYFANMPSVLFSCLFLIGLFAQKITQPFNFRTVSEVTLFAVLALLVSIPLVVSAQRASVGYIAFYTLLLAMFGFYRYPKRTFCLLLLFMLCLLTLSGFLKDAFALVWSKTSLVGFNMRFEELGAVWHRISGSLLDVLFGTGWGGTFESPAVGEVRVNFTHSFLTSALLKTGLCGLILAGFYIYGFIQILWRTVPTLPLMSLALFGPLVIDVFLYASFKSLDFGLTLLLIVTLRFYTPDFASKEPQKLQ